MWCEQTLPVFVALHACAQVWGLYLDICVPPCPCTKYCLNSTEFNNCVVLLDRLLQENYAFINLNPFEVLELPHTATEEEIKDRYRKVHFLLCAGGHILLSLFKTACVCMCCARSLKEWALPRASHPDEIALAGSSRLRYCFRTHCLCVRLSSHFTPVPSCSCQPRSTLTSTLRILIELGAPSKVCVPYHWHPLLRLCRFSLKIPPPVPLTSFAIS